MKKLLCFALSVMLLTSLAFPASAAGQSAEAYALYKAAMEKIEGKSLELSGEMKVYILVGETHIDETDKISIKQLTNSDGETEYMLKAGKNLTDYYKDGYIYNSKRIVRTKSKKPFEEAIREEYTLKDNLKEDFFTNAVVEDVKDGKMITCTLNAVQTKEIISKLYSKSYDTYMGSIDKEYGFDTTKILFVVDKNSVIKKQEIIPSFSVKKKQMHIEAEFTTTLNVDSVGKITKIDFPDDLDSYKEA